MGDDRSHKLMMFVILFLLGTTLFNTLRANRVEQSTTSFRKEATYQLALTRVTLDEQKATNVRLEQQLAQLIEAQAAEQPTD